MRPIIDDVHIINKGNKTEGYIGIFPLFPSEIKIKLT